MAACSTVLPFSTEIWRPSIVNVTVSIYLRIANGSRGSQGGQGTLVNLGQDAVVLVDRDALQRGIEPDALIRRLIRHGDHDVVLPTARVLQRQRQGHLEGFPKLVDVDREFGSFHSILHLQ